MRPLLNGAALGRRQYIMTIRERVHGVVGYYDGVLDGVADFHGLPHAFELHGDLDEEVLIYRLARLSPEAMTLFEEAWGIWLRWERHPPTTVDSNTVPALPRDRDRYAQLKPILDVALRVPPDSPLLAKGDSFGVPTLIRNATVGGLSTLNGPT
jgi:hypothetical protein